MGGELAPAPVSYDTLTRRVSKEICVALEGYLWAITAQLLLETMDYEGRLVVLMCLFSFVVRSKESWVLQQGMGGPLLQLLGEECVAKVFSAFIVAGGAAASFPRGGRATRNANRHQSRDFDATRGYPGEDISPSFLLQ